MDEQPTSGSNQSVETRLTSLFSSEVAKPAAPTPEATPEPEVAQETAPEEPPAEEEFEVDGVSYVLPIELKAKVSEWKEGALRREDYTRKTQELADLHRQVSTMAETAQMRQQFEESISTEKAELNQVRATLKQYREVDWASLDTEQILRFRGKMDQLKERAQELDAGINAKAGQFTQQAERQKRTLIEQGNKYLSQTIKGWGQDTMREVAGAAEEVGYTKGEIDNVFDVRFVRLAHKAAQYDKLMAGKPAALAAAQKAPPVVKPGASKGQRAVADQKYVEARKALKSNPNSLDAAAQAFLRHMQR